MENKQILDYVQLSRQSGFNDDQIKDELVKAGWTSTDVETALTAQTEGIHKTAVSNNEDDAYEVPARNKSISGKWFLSPIIGILMLLGFYALSNFILQSLQGSLPGDSENINILENIFRIIVGFIGILIIQFIPTALILGFIYRKKRILKDGVNYDIRSGKGKESEVPDEIKKWNWGAAGLAWIWGVRYNVWLGLLAWVPFFNLFWWIVMGIKGSEWAWRKQKWTSANYYLASQKKWKVWGITFLILSLLYSTVTLASIVRDFTTASPDATQQTSSTS